MLVEWKQKWQASAALVGLNEQHTAGPEVD
jgi:hypothetical protein